ncbi:MAG: CopD family protein, partial [Nocardioidaceae bacterium]|nr:CopD family protein [Nocardioidaceae bacterium]
LGTTFGRGLLVRLVGALGFAAALWRVRGRLRAALLVAFGAVLVASFAMTGHGVTNALMFVSTSLHVAVASLWIGGLAGLVAWALRDPAAHADTLARFSRVALCCVGVLVVTGGFQAWRQVREWGALTGTTYGRELLVKLGLVVLVLVAAGLSRQSVRRRADAPLGVLRRAVGVELVLGLCVFGVTASLAATQPAYSAYHPVVSADLKAGPDLVQLSGVPTGEQQMDLHVYVFGKDQQPSTPKQMTVTVSLASADLGPLPITLTNAGPGHYVGQVVVPVQGDWTVAVTVRTSAIDEYTVTNPLPIR